MFTVTHFDGYSYTSFASKQRFDSYANMFNAVDDDDDTMY